MRRRWLLLLVAAPLGGCTNMVLSDTPLFTAANAHGAPEFRSGVWKLDIGEDCPADLNRPVQTWPKCASGVIYNRRGPATPPRELRTRLVVGNPPILQEDYRTSVAYRGVQLLAFDAKGRITAYAAWTALCGPPPPPRRGEDGTMESGGLTRDLLPGLEADVDNCKAHDPETVRRASQMSRGWGSSVFTQRWVRPATRADRMDSDVIYSPGVFRKPDEAPAAPAP